jgi:hypothetical protein
MKQFIIVAFLLVVLPATGINFAFDYLFNPPTAPMTVSYFMSLYVGSIPLMLFIIAGLAGMVGAKPATGDATPAPAKPKRQYESVWQNGPNSINIKYTDTGRGHMVDSGMAGYLVGYTADTITYKSSPDATTVITKRIGYWG